MLYLLPNSSDPFPAVAAAPSILPASTIATMAREAQWDAKGEALLTSSHRRATSGQVEVSSNPLFMADCSNFSVAASTRGGLALDNFSLTSSMVYYGNKLYVNWFYALNMYQVEAQIK